MRKVAAVMLAVLFLLSISSVSAQEKFDEVLFWSEFPAEVDWETLDDKLSDKGLVIRVYVASSSREDYYNWQKRVGSLENIEVGGVWPTLPKEKGYWFSGFTEKEGIDFLEEFRGIDMKIDIEPPIPNGAIPLWLLKHTLRRGKNSFYLQEKIKSLSEDSNIIVSTFPFPKFMLNNMGFYDGKEVSLNYMYYSSFLHPWLRPFYQAYYGNFIRKNNDGRTYFALGLLSTGVLGNERTYSSEKELEKDMEFFHRNGVKKVVIFRAEALLERNWIALIKEHSP